jgi:hypothetical protein
VAAHQQQQQGLVLHLGAAEAESLPQMHDCQWYGGLKEALKLQEQNQQLASLHQCAASFYFAWKLISTI